MDSSDDSKKNFLKHVFNFDNDSKSEILNIIQYALLAIIPVVILTKTMAKYVPEADDKKGSLEISAEIMIQVIFIFIGLLLIHRIIIFIPTYSEEKYPHFHISYIILAVLMITISLQTKLGEKVNIIVERITELWEGKKDDKKKKNGNNNVKVSQPISGQITGRQMPAPMPPMQQSAYSDGTAINSLPTNDMSNLGGNQNTMAPQQLPDYNDMYQKDPTPLVGAATPGMSEGFSEPMAANAVLGGGFGSSW
jgi:hypothetical protein